MSSSVAAAAESATVPSEKVPSRNLTALNPRCIGCGAENPHGLHLAVTAEGDVMHAEWIPGSDWESFEGVIHGGIICTVLDEAMSKAILASGVQAFTVELRLRYRQKLSIGQPVQIRGWIVQKEKRRITAEGAVCGPSGEEYAHAWGVFLLPPRSAGPPAK